MVPELWYLNLVPELLGLGVLGYSDPLGLGVPDCLLLGVLGVLGVSEPGFLLVNLGLGIFRFSDFQMFDSRDICLQKMLVGYRGIHNKGVLERPWTKWMVLKAISSILKFQFTAKC